MTTIRQEARRWLEEHWDPSSASGVRPDPGADSAGTSGQEWLELVVDSGWAAPSWSTDAFGKGVSAEESRTVAEEFAKVGAPGSGQDVVNLWAATVVSYGSDAIKNTQLRNLLLGRTNMCLLYSEPGAGSDLASVQTRADRDGDEWVVTGQKVWTSSGRHADFAFLIARTDWDATKHRGITFFFLPMDQPGVDVRPLRQATGDSRFNEVFLTDARVHDDNRFGAPGDGWFVLQTALAYERAAMSQAGRRRANHQNTQAVRSAGDEAPAPVPDLSLLDLARDTGRADDAVIRQRLMKLYAMGKVNDWNNERAKAAMEQGTSSPIVSLGKLAMSGILHTAGSLQAELLGAEGMLAGTDSPRSADATYAMLNAFFTSIGGGTDQIQRNIIGERVLGLPKEPEIDKNLPFREARKASVD